MPSEPITINTPIVSDNPIKGTQLDTLKRNIEGITKGALPYFESIFKQILSANLNNAKSLYNFLLAEQIERNVKLSTKTTHIRVITYSTDFYILKTLKKIQSKMF